MLLNTFADKREEISNRIYVVGFFSLAILIDIVNSIFTTSMINILLILMLEFLISLLYVCTFRTRILMAIMNSMLIITTEVIILLLLSVVLGQGVNDIISNGMGRIMGIILSKLLCFVIVKMLTDKVSKEVAAVGINYWILFAVMFVITTMTMYTFCKTLEEGASEHIRNFAAACSCGLGAGTLIVLYLYEKTFRQKYELMQRQLTEINLKNQVKHYNNITMTHGQIKKVRHDLRNHLLAIQGYIRKGEYDICNQYISNMLDTINKETMQIVTGNTVIDSILSAKKSEAEDRGIDFNSQIMIPADLPINPEDACVMLGNALDNAIEANLKVTGRKYINLSLTLNRDSLIFKLSNACISEKVNEWDKSKS